MLAGLTVFSWAFLGMRDTWLETGGATMVRTSISVMHLLAGYLFISRSPLKAEASMRDMFLSLPSMIAGGCAFRFAPATQDWSWWAQGLFVAGIAWTAVSLFTLGRSFAILPALREVVTRGPYRWLRHPAYLGELFIGLGCWVAGPNLLTGLAFLALIPTTLWRIAAEERTLRQSDAYWEYVAKVPWRLVPWVW